MKWLRKQSMKDIKRWIWMDGMIATSTLEFLKWSGRWTKRVVRASTWRSVRCHDKAGAWRLQYGRAEKMAGLWISYSSTPKVDNPKCGQRCSISDERNKEAMPSRNHQRQPYFCVRLVNISFKRHTWNVQSWQYQPIPHWVNEQHYVIWIYWCKRQVT